MILFHLTHPKHHHIYHQLAEYPKTTGKTPNETSDDIDNFNSSPP